MTNTKCQNVPTIYTKIIDNWVEVWVSGWFRMDFPIVTSPRIQTSVVWQAPTRSRQVVHSLTVWIDRKSSKKLQLNSPFLWWPYIQPTWHHCPNTGSPLALAIYIFVFLILVHYTYIYIYILYACVCACVCVYCLIFVICNVIVKLCN